MMPFASDAPRQHQRAFSANYPDTSRSSYLTRLIALFQRSIDEMILLDNNSMRKNTKAFDKHVESMATFIYESMSTSARNYHHIQHVFDVVETNTCATKEGEKVLDPTAVLAALFHDCVYANVDGGLSDEQRKKLCGALEDGKRQDNDNDGGSVQLRSHSASMDDPLLKLVLKVFGFEAGQVLQAHQGQNEYLSAVIAIRELAPLLPVESLLQIAACIEATIPFRGVDESGSSALEFLYKRIRSVSTELGLHLSDEDCIRAVQRATLVGNEDVGGFGTPDHDLFVDKTWSLLPETNEALRDPSYSIYEYHCALYKMYSFFSHVNASLIFHQFRGFPSDSLVTRLTERAESNIRIGASYVGAKLVGMTFLASFAQLTGGDAPISLFMGTLLCAPGSCLCTMEDRLGVESNKRPKLSVQSKSNNNNNASNSQVYKLLTEGRHSETSFDLRRSPLSTYFFRLLGEVEIEKLLGVVDTYPMTELKARAFLTELPKESVRFVAEIMADVATERSDLILKVAGEF